MTWHTRVLTFVFLTVPTSATLAQGSFDFSLRGPWRVQGEPGATVSAEFDLMLGTTGLEIGTPGASAYSFGVLGSPWTVTGWSESGTVAETVSPDDGFNNTQLTDDGGLVHAVVRSFTDPNGGTLPVEPATKLLTAIVEATVPTEGCTDAELAFVPGLRGSGQEVKNVVTYAGESVAPTLGSLDTRICVAAPVGFRIGGQLAAAASEGATVELHPLVEVVTDVDGAQGWSFSLESIGPCELVAATTDGTAGADVATDPEGVRDGGFEKTELAPPELNAGRVGVVSAVVLSFTEPVILTTGVHPVLDVTLLCDTTGLAEGDVLEHDLVYPSNDGSPPATGLLRASGQPVKNAITLDGETNEPNIEDGVVTVSVVGGPSAFVRCDPNDDGRVDIADPIWLVNELFRNGPETTCPDAGNCNGDSNPNDLSDAVYAIAYLFQGGPAPAAPFPGCGIDAASDETSCPPSSRAVCP